MAGKSERSPGAVVREIRRQTRRKFAALEKIRIVLEGLKGEASIAELYRREGISPNLYYRWSKDFLEAGKKRLQGDTLREANSRGIIHGEPARVGICCHPNRPTIGRNQN